MKISIPGLVIVCFLGGGGWIVVDKMTNSGPGYVTVEVKLPQLDTDASRGKKSFDVNCAECHGENGSGSDKGPPLIHPIYNPGHHNDESFLSAMERGVKMHHWPYGDMPKQPQVDRRQRVDIIRFIRTVQTANGIETQQHSM